MIYAHLDTGSTIDIRLREALLVYTSRDSPYGPERILLEARPIVDGPDGPEYGAGWPADGEYLNRILHQDTKASTLRALDRRLIAVGENEAAWWAPASRQAPYFSTGSGMVRHSGETVSMPALLYHVRGRQLRIRALASRSRPGPKTPLYVAPLWNIHGSGSLCIGTMPVPVGDPADCIDAWVRAFWDSAFTTPHCARLCAHPTGYSRMLRELRKLPRFPSRWLVPTNERVEQWLNQK